MNATIALDSEFAKAAGVLRGDTVAIIGLGYVGLPTALACSAAGRRVVGIDISHDRLDRIRARHVDLIPDDHERLRVALEQDDFQLTPDVARMPEADTVIVCVPTTVDEHLLPDLDLLRQACERVVEHAREGQLLVLTSTTYAGTTRDFLVGPLAERGLVVGEDIFVAFSPERINPGMTSHTQSDVPRVVGGVTAQCTARAQDVLSRISGRVHAVSTPEAAELTKLYENTFRAVNIAFVNEFAGVCRELGADVMEVLDAAETKPFGFMRFNPGPGVGGHCIPCDPHYLLWQLRAHRMTMPIVESAMAGIARRPVEVVDRVRELLGGRRIPVGDAKVLVVGVAYKPDVEDVRESPAIEIVSRLSGLGAEVTVADSYVPRMRLNDGVTLVSRRLADVDVRDFDLVLVHTRHAADDLSCLNQAGLVLDASYSLAELPAAVALLVSIRRLSGSPGSEATEAAALPSPRLESRSRGGPLGDCRPDNSGGCSRRDSLEARSSYASAPRSW